MLILKIAYIFLGIAALGWSGLCFYAAFYMVR